MKGKERENEVQGCRTFVIVKASEPEGRHLRVVPTGGKVTHLRPQDDSSSGQRNVRYNP